MPVEPLAFLILCLAAYRATRFVVWDSLIGAHPDTGTPFAKALDTWAWKPDGSDRSWVRGKVGGLLSCPFCAGFWISLLIACLWLRLWPWELGVEGWLVALAVAGGQSLLNVADRKMAD